MIRMNAAETLRLALPFWERISKDEKDILVSGTIVQTYKTGTIIMHSTDSMSPGIRIVKSGRLRVYISSADGKQYTIQRISDNELFSIGMSCVLENMIMDVDLETESECEILLIPRAICRRLYDSNPIVKQSTIEIITERFAATMRILESVVFSSMKNRIANSLVEYSLLAGSSVVNVTHANIAADIGTLREVVTRRLKQFQDDGLITIGRGHIAIKNMQGLIDLRGEHLESVSDLLYPKQSS